MNLPAWLIVRSGPDAGQQVPLSGEKVILGRSSQCDVVLADERASRQHACLRHVGDSWTVEDLGSSNGTLLNGQRLQAHVPQVFGPGDQLQIGDTCLSIEVREDRAVESDDLPQLADAGPSGQRRPRGLVWGLVAIAAILVLAVAALAALLLTSDRGAGDHTSLTPAPLSQAPAPPPPAEILNRLQDFEGRLFASGEMLLKFEPGTSQSQADAFLAQEGLSARDAIPALGLWRVTVDSGQAAPLLVDLMGHPLLSFSEPNAFAQLWGEPDDPYWPQQWNMRLIRAPEGWDLATGVGQSQVIIAIVDSGLDLDHPDLQARVVPGYDFVEGDATPQDENGHGTHVTGIAAAIGNNGQGVAGVDWGGQIMPVKVVDAAGECTVFDVAAGIVWATDHGARVLNLSLGFPLISILVDQGLSGADALREAIEYAYAHNVLVVVASGNEYQELALPGYPAAYAHVLAVGAVNPQSEHAYYSSAGNYVDVVAPGGEMSDLHDTAGVFSTLPLYDVALTEEGVANGYDALEGTSMAAPHVAGLAALVWSVNPTLSNDQVAAIIEATAQDIGPAGRDDCFGAGLIDVRRALEMALSDQLPAGRPQEHGLAMSGLCDAFTQWPEEPFAAPFPTLDLGWEDWNWDWGQ